MLRALIRPDQIFYCFADCGVCEGYCPVARQEPTFSPRRIVMAAAQGNLTALLSGDDIWRCRSCGRCSYHCPAAVDFLSLIRELREQALALKTEAVARQGATSKDGIKGDGREAA